MIKVRDRMPRLRWLPGLATMGIACVAVPAAAQTPPAAVDGPVELLKAGDYLWEPDVAPKGPVMMIVSLDSQRAYVYRNGVPIGMSTVSTGRDGHKTPTGVFTILQKDRDHKSNLYNDAPMPFMQRLTWDGIAMHAGNLPGYPASHGCIRLPAAFAELLYGVTELGLTVVITDDAAVPQISPAPPELAMPPQAAAGDGQSKPMPFSWHPELAPSGPVSLVISGRDRRIVILRNGVEIGSATIAIDGAVAATEAFTLTSIVEGKPQWLRLPLSGKKPSSAKVTAGDKARLHMPEAFRQEVIGILKPGATLLVTRDTLHSSGTGKPLTVITVDSK